MSIQFYVDQILTQLALLADETSSTSWDEDSLRWLATEATVDDVRWLLAALAHHVRSPSGAQDRLLAAIFRQLIECEALLAAEYGDTLWASLVTLYGQLGSGSAARHLLLRFLALRGGPDHALLADLLVQDPPNDAQQALLVFAPLFQRLDVDPNLLFPRLLDALRHPLIAASAMDLANFYTRRGVVANHPAADRALRLIGLLGELTQRLAQLEEQVGSHAPAEDQQDEARLAQRVDDSVALAVSLCDALALIGNQAAVGKLYQVLDLRHRRLRTEAAAALARFGEQAGIEALVNLAAEPVVRLRVLAYAEELDCLDRVEPQFQTLQSRAEAELALWLAQPTQFGIPPTLLETFDCRELYWPGFDDEVTCFLFRFTYRLAAGEYSNIGIAGPCVYAFAADLADLPAEDIYAAFAGWQVEHEDIYETEIGHLAAGAEAEVVRYERRLHDEGYHSIEPQALGSFFGSKALVAYARREGTSGVAVVDNETCQWHPVLGSRPIDANLAYSIYKGRKLMRSFNP